MFVRGGEIVRGWNVWEEGHLFQNLVCICTSLAFLVWSRFTQVGTVSHLSVCPAYFLFCLFSQFGRVPGHKIGEGGWCRSCETSKQKARSLRQSALALRFYCSLCMRVFCLLVSRLLPPARLPTRPQISWLLDLFITYYSTARVWFQERVSE